MCVCVCVKTANCRAKLVAYRIDRKTSPVLIAANNNLIAYITALRQLCEQIDVKGQNRNMRYGMRMGKLEAADKMQDAR